ncbi:MAG: aminotransferase class I/II-fold pyridoxal phosphate-dependent enzyme [Halobacteriovoraceae bacterium]|nr:aminotransferase class I/II-fold pyridoxal phosphate-dependent enzyme [Halobacteriovoraceae bacterium]
MSISDRALKLQSAPSAIMLGHQKWSEDPFSKQNPLGILNFGIAENHLLNDLIIPKINQNVNLCAEHIQYNTLYGLEEVRKTVAIFFENYLNLKNVQAENIIIQSGLSCICESLSFSLFDQNDIIMIAAPYYTGFEHDFTKRFGCEFLKVPLKTSNKFEHEISSFITTYQNHPHPEKIKAVLITHPHNPTGEKLSYTFGQKLIDFCLKNDLELICDEVYALSSHTKASHQSLYQLAIDANVKAHFLYGMAKDFALAGLKVGFYLSPDMQLTESLKNVSYFHPVSTQTQLLVANILSDTHFLDTLICENQKRLASVVAKIRNELPQFSFLSYDAGLFIILNLSSYCQNFADEQDLFNYFLNELKINFTAGQDMSFQEPGYFRVCFAKEKGDISEFITRMKTFKFKPKEQK